MIDRVGVHVGATSSVVAFSSADGLLLPLTLPFFRVLLSILQPRISFACATKQVNRRRTVSAVCVRRCDLFLFLLVLVLVDIVVRRAA